MFLTLDLDRNLLVKTAGSTDRETRVEAKRSESGPVVIQVVKGDAVVTSEVTDLLLKAITKPLGEYDGDPLAATDTFVWTAAVGAYVGAINYITVDLNGEFFVDGNPDNDKASLSLALGIAHRFDAGAPWKETENDVGLTLRNNYVRDTDGTPLEQPNAEDWLSGRAVRYDVAQALSGGQRTQARANLGLVETLVVALGDQESDMTTGLKVTFRMPYNFTLTATLWSLVEAATGAAFIGDIKVDGASVFTTKPSIDAGDTASDDATTPEVIDDGVIPYGSEVTIFIDQIGAVTAGVGPVVCFIGTQT